MLATLVYITLVVFIIGLIYRALKIQKMPVHLRWELAPIPHEKGKASYGGSYLEEFEWWKKPRKKSIINEMWYMFQEIAFLKGVWKHNRKMWYFSFPFHFGGLYMMGGLALLILINAILQMGDTKSVLLIILCVLTSFMVYSLGAVGTLGLLILRLTDRALKPFTSPAAIFNLILLCSIYVTGLVSFFSAYRHVSELTDFVKGLLTFNLSAGLPGPAALHVSLASLFLVYLPFSYMTHFLAKYFTYREVRWNNEPMKGGSRMEKEVNELLGQKVSWSAPHIRGEGKKTWVDVASGEVNK
jgi:nitrate reductase gamma subunit